MTRPGGPGACEPVHRTQAHPRRPPDLVHRRVVWRSGPLHRELGFQYIIDVHRNLEITDDQRERFVALYLEALDEAGIPNDEPFRAAVREHVEFGSHVAQQNSWAKNDAELHPIRQVPKWNWAGSGYRTDWPLGTRCLLPSAADFSRG